MRQIADKVHVLDRPLRVFGLEIGARMTVLQLDKGLLIHSPVDVEPEVVAPLGQPRWVLAPNKLHHLFVDRWIQAGIEAWAAPGLPEKRRDLQFDRVVQAGAPFGADVAVLPLTCFPFSNEVVVLHRPSGTLILTDLVFNFPPTASWATRFAMRCAGAYPGCRASYLEQVGMRRTVARKELGEIFEWDFDRVVMAHGTIIESGGRQALREAYRWLGL